MGNTSVKSYIIIAAEGVQLLLNFTEIIPSHGVLDFGQCIYCIGLILTALIFVIANFSRYLKK